MTSRTRQLVDSMLRHHGFVIGGADLRKALGFRSAATFHRAVREKTLQISIFDIPGRRGKFAFTADVATWLAEIGGTGGPAKAETPDTDRCIGRNGEGKARKEVKM